VRACAGASRNESEFVGRLREHGLQARPRYAEGAMSKVAGYSVKLTDTAGHDGGRAVWYGGGRLARDLTLPALGVAGARITARSAVRSESGARVAAAGGARRLSAARS
jgi:hypothetical protein